MKLFQYAILFHPKKKKDEDTAGKSKIIVDLKTVLAADDKSATILASRDIPQDYIEQLDQVEIAIRPF